MVIPRRTAIALDNAMLYDRVSAHEQQLNEDPSLLEIAKQLLIEIFRR